MEFVTEWDDTGFVCASKYRKEIIRVLLKHSSTPKSISELTEIKIPHVSRTLHQLGQRDLVRCLTPDRSKGKIFGLTNKGLEIANRIENGIS